MPEYDPNRDIAPPLSQYADHILVDDVGPGGLGRGVEFWKVLLHRTLATRIRNDQAAAVMNDTDTTPLTDEQKPPRLAADRSPAAIDPDMVAKISEACDTLSKRLDDFEAAQEQRRDAERAERRAAAALDEAERLFTTPDPEDEDQEPEDRPKPN
jgi:hypothetical protein